MQCRRDHERFVLEEPLEGTVHVLRDVVLCPDGQGEHVQVITQVPALTDELLTLRVVGDNDKGPHVVRVVESRPVIVEGRLRHELHLEERPRAASEEPPEDPAS